MTARERANSHTKPLGWSIPGDICRIFLLKKKKNTRTQINYPVYNTFLTYEYNKYANICKEQLPKNWFRRTFWKLTHLQSIQYGAPWACKELCMSVSNFVSHWHPKKDKPLRFKIWTIFHHLTENTSQFLVTDTLSFGKTFLFVFDLALLNHISKV